MGESGSKMCELHTSISVLLRLTVGYLPASRVTTQVFDMCQGSKMCELHTSISVLLRLTVGYLPESVITTCGSVSS